MAYPEQVAGLRPHSNPLAEWLEPMPIKGIGFEAISIGTDSMNDEKIVSQGVPLGLPKLDRKEKNFVQLLETWNAAKKRRLSGEELRYFLRTAERRFHREEFLPTDPVEFIHRYRDPRDQEAVGLLAALLAYGNVKAIRSSIGRALELLGQIAPGPSAAIRTLTSRARIAQAQHVFRDFRHRFNSGHDLVVLFGLIRSSWERFGTLGDDFASRLDPSDSTIERALSGFVQDHSERARDLGATRSFFFLLNDPKDGSACKRWCMYLRWMGRKDSIDLGLWMALPDRKGLRPNQLVIPLDTHLAKIVRHLKLTGRKNADWKMALEVTNQLKSIDEHDPIRYDFALCRLGILRQI